MSGLELTAISGKAPGDAASQIEPRGAENLVRKHARLEPRIDGRDRPLGEHDLALAADAVPQGAQPIGRRRPVPGETAALTAGRRFTALVQRAFSVPSLCSSAFEVFCAAGNVEPSLRAGAWAYG